MAGDVLGECRVFSGKRKKNELPVIESRCCEHGAYVLIIENIEDEELKFLYDDIGRRASIMDATGTKELEKKF